MAVAGVGGEGGRGGGEGGGVVHGPVEQRLRAGRVAEVALNLGSHLWERERGIWLVQNCKEPVCKYDFLRR